MNIFWKIRVSIWVLSYISMKEAMTFTIFWSKTAEVISPFEIRVKMPSNILKKTFSINFWHLRPLIFLVFPFFPGTNSLKSRFCMTISKFCKIWLLFPLNFVKLCLNTHLQTLILFLVSSYHLKYLQTRKMLVLFTYCQDF